MLAVTLATRLPALFVGLYSNDEATYSALAVRILSGALPYSGAVDHKPVGIELTYAAVYAVVGPYRLVFVRALLVLVVATTGWILARISERPWTAILYVCASACGLACDVQAANTELFLNLPLCGAALCALRGRWTAAGALTAVASLYKYQAGLAGVAWLLAGGARAVPGLAMGFGAVWAGCLGIFAWTHTLGAFVRWGWAFNFSYMAVLGARQILVNAVENTLLVGAAWAPLVIAALRGRSRFGFIWLAVMLLAVVPGGRFFPHYYLMALPPLCLLARPSMKLLWGLPLVVAAIVAAAFWYDLRPGLRPQTQTMTAVGDWVQQHSACEDRIFVWGGSSGIYYYARRVMGTRFAFTNYHTGKIWGSPLLDDVNAIGTERWIAPYAWTELMADLTTEPPPIVIDAAAGRLGLFDRHPIARYPLLARFVAEHYQLAATVEGVPIYQRKSRPTP